MQAEIQIVAIRLGQFFANAVTAATGVSMNSDGSDDFCPNGIAECYAELKLERDPLSKLEFVDGWMGHGFVGGKMDSAGGQRIVKNSTYLCQQRVANQLLGKANNREQKLRHPPDFASWHWTLSTSDDVEDRETEKGRLEEAYEKCDRDLDELIVQHYTELTTAIRTYQSITERITNSRNKIKQVSAVDSLEGPLLQVEGLSDLRLELHSKKMNMHLVLIDELHRHLYIKSTSRVGQQGKAKGKLSSLVKDASPVPLLDVTNLSTPRKFLDSSQFSTPGNSSGKDVSLVELKEDLEVDPEENSSVFMGILIKGLAKLRKIPETVKAIQDRLEQELKQIVKRSTTQVADNGYQRGENLVQENQPRLLLELLELLFDKFNAVAAAHAVVLGHLQQTVASPSSQHDGEIKLYDMADVWVKIQDVLQMLLTEYLDMKNTRASSEPSAQLSYASSGREFAAFFAKKKPQRPKNPLFKFESSSHAISMSAYLREQRRELYSRSGELQVQLIPPSDEVFKKVELQNRHLSRI
ncbi:exocyst complex component 4-like [Sphaerodactylus townsendi]|uniref:exocyst complex component 4-like n=1 Tax=Sphaerodactylus townsendi TaxID=933632 RepID=UPI002026DAE1|nr:exocyst complex component 4-like [Sphaerodactylus townsendi]